MPLQPTHYALVVGINDYPDYGTGGRSLKGAIKDAQRVDEWLRDVDIGGGLPKDNCKLVLSNGQPLGPLQMNIDVALQEIWKNARTSGGERFYFYFSGHGLSVQSENVALCLANWSSDFRHAALSSQSYLEFLKQCTPFQEVVVFLDCCRVRQGGVIGMPTQLGCAVPIEGAGAKRSLVAYATEFQQAAFEAPADEETGTDGVVKNEVRGHFTEALIAALRGGAAQPAGGVTAEALKKYLEAEVPRIAKASNHNQVPQIPFDLPLGVVFGAAKPIANCEIRFSAGRHGTIRLEDGDLTAIREDDASTGPWRVALKPGLYNLEEMATGAMKQFRFRPTESSDNVEF
jgi:hypothetical protein